MAQVSAGPFQMYNSWTSFKENTEVSSESFKEFKNRHIIKEIKNCTSVVLLTSHNLDTFP